MVGFGCTKSGHAPPHPSIKFQSTIFPHSELSVIWQNGWWLRGIVGLYKRFMFIVTTLRTRKDVSKNNFLHVRK
jgi:hypothetical protein